MNDANNPKNNDYKSPSLCVDVIVDMGSGLFALVKRKNDPQGWALPGGFVDVGETVEHAALREVQEEIGLDVELIRQFHVYSDPRRDTRAHSVSVVFLARGKGTPKAGSDAARFRLTQLSQINALFPASRRPRRSAAWKLWHLCFTIAV